jgi:hypothetical protein
MRQHRRLTEPHVTLRRPVADHRLPAVRWCLVGWGRALRAGADGMACKRPGVQIPSAPPQVTGPIRPPWRSVPALPAANQQQPSRASRSTGQDGTARRKRLVGRAAAPTTAACSSNTVAQAPSRAITTANATCTILREAIRQARRTTSGSVEVPNVCRARARMAGADLLEVGEADPGAEQHREPFGEGSLNAVGPMSILVGRSCQEHGGKVDVGAPRDSVSAYDAAVEVALCRRGPSSLLAGPQLRPAALGTDPASTEPAGHRQIRLLQPRPRRETVDQDSPVGGAANRS